MNLPAGRELDALVEKAVMRVVTTPHPIAYSTTWEGMRLVVEQMRKLGFHFRLSIDSDAWAVFDRCEKTNEVKSADTAPLAACLAALSAMGALDEKGDLAPPKTKVAPHATER